MWTTISRHGWPFIAGFAAATGLIALYSETLGWIGVGLTAWCIAFFRDPARVVPNRAGLVVAPADGRIQTVDLAPPPAELDMGAEPRSRVSIFMSVFDVHVNRAPHAATIAKIVYRPGKFFNAALDKASAANERQSLRLVLADGRDLACVQIAGLIARRIVTEVRENDTVATGARIGMIRFGSRVDVYLPTGAVPLVAAGGRAVAGETVIADLDSPEPRRPAITR